MAKKDDIEVPAYLRFKLGSAAAFKQGVSWRRTKQLNSRRRRSSSIRKIAGCLLESQIVGECTSPNLVNQSHRFRALNNRTRNFLPSYMEDWVEATRGRTMRKAVPLRPAFHGLRYRSRPRCCSTIRCVIQSPRPVPRCLPDAYASPSFLKTWRQWESLATKEGFGEAFPQR